ncbi:MAG TPA: DUF2442 domain-containing protein [Allosphingosinicella sp.]|jgi:hypothetical protein
MNFLTTIADERIVDVRFPGGQLLVELKDGRTLATPLAWYPRLLKATPKQRANWELAGGGYGIHWPDLDEDLSSEGLLRGAPAPGAIGERREGRAGVNQSATTLSPAIARIDYDEGTRTLHIWFSGGDRYAYMDVPPAVFERLRGAPSVGAFVSELIKPLYRYEKRAA